MRDISKKLLCDELIKTMDDLHCVSTDPRLKPELKSLTASICAVRVEAVKAQSMFMLIDKLENLNESLEAIHDRL